MRDLPTRIDRHSREVVDGSKIADLTLVVVIGGVSVHLSCCVDDIDGQPVGALDSLARDDAADSIESARYECKRRGFNDAC